VRPLSRSCHGRRDRRVAMRCVVTRNSFRSSPSSLTTAADHSAPCRNITGGRTAPSLPSFTAAAAILMMRASSSPVGERSLLYANKLVVMQGCGPRQLSVLNLGDTSTTKISGFGPGLEGAVFEHNSVAMPRSHHMN